MPFRGGAQNPKFKGAPVPNTPHAGSKPYLRIYAGPQRGQYVHRLVMEAKLGRPLKKNEQVDHVNGDTLDNRPENLQVVPAHKHFNYTAARVRKERGIPAADFSPPPLEHGA